MYDETKLWTVKIYQTILKWKFVRSVEKNIQKRDKKR
jgi:hypothetical protein